MPAAGVVLHLLPDDAASRVEHSEAGADLVGEAEQVQLRTELAVVALRCLLDAVLVLTQLVLRRPRGAVDPLQLRVLLRAAPVGRGHAGERPAVPDDPGVREVRSAAEVLPDDLTALAVDVRVDGQLARTDLDGLVGRLHGAALQTDEFELVGLGREQVARLRFGDDAALEALTGPLDALHLLREGLQVLRGEGLVDIEVVVEAVGDGRADAEPCLRVDALHRLREHMRGRVPEDREPVGRADGDGFDLGACGHRPIEVPERAVDPGGDHLAVLAEERPSRRHRGPFAGLRCGGFGGAHFGVPPRVGCQA